MLLLSSPGLQLLPLLPIPPNDLLVLFVLTGLLGVCAAEVFHAVGLSGELGLQIGNAFRGRWI